MIIDIWIPVRKGSGKNKIIIRHDLIENIDSVISLKRKGYVVRYTCDVCKSNKINNTTTSVLFSENFIYNSLKSQTCRSCRSRISEYEIKKTQIDYDVIKNSFESSNYTLLTSKQDYNLSYKKSQMVLNSKCAMGHYYKSNWNNWSKGKRCRICYDKKRHDISVDSKSEWELYKSLVLRYTNINYKKYINIINPLNLKRGHSKSSYNLDHKFSISEGFKNGILPIIIGSHHNLEMLNSIDNYSKSKKCSITSEHLFNEYFKSFGNW